MLIFNELPEHDVPLAARDAEMLGKAAASEVEAFLERREGHRPTPLVSLPGLAHALDVGAIHVKDEGRRLGLGSFKALGGSYAVIRLVIEEASRRLGRSLPITGFLLPELRSVAAEMTIACATDGNHGRSVAQGAELVGARCVIFVHAGVSERRAAAIARHGAKVIRVAGGYDASVAEAARVAAAEGWTTVSDTSWPGYERIPGLVMQGYTALMSEALRDLPAAPTHVFVQAGVGGIAAAAAGHLAAVLEDRRPFFVVVDPARAACIFGSARAGRLVEVEHGEATIMAMLDCHKPSVVAWRILSRVADAFMTVEEDEAVEAMRKLARPVAGDPSIVSGESGCVGLAGLLQVAQDRALRARTRLGPDARVLLINTEGATDPEIYERLVGQRPDVVAASAQ